MDQEYERKTDSERHNDDAEANVKLNIGESLITARAAQGWIGSWRSNIVGLDGDIKKVVQELEDIQRKIEFDPTPRPELRRGDAPPVFDDEETEVIVIQDANVT